MPKDEERLAGIRVLVTRPAEQAQTLIDLVRGAGGEPVPFPTLAIEPLIPDSRQVDRLTDADTVIFVSANAALNGYPVLRSLDHQGRRFIAIGRATARTLRDMGCADVAVPGGDSTSEDLLASPLLGEVAGHALCIVRGQGGREKLHRELAARGARVSSLECYRRRLPEEPDIGLLSRALASESQELVISVTSVTGLENLIALTPAEHHPRLLARPLVVIGRRQKAAALAQGWTGAVLEAGPGDAEIVDTIAGWRGQCQ